MTPCEKFIQNIRIWNYPIQKPFFNIQARNRS